MNTIPEYADTPIWITEIGLHVGFDGWEFSSPTELVPVGSYHWDKLSNYMVSILDWLDVNAQANKVEKWFFPEVVDRPSEANWRLHGDHLIRWTGRGCVSELPG